MRAEAVRAGEDAVTVAGQRLAQVDRPGRTSGRAELSRERLPILENWGQFASVVVSKLIDAASQATLPSAAFGLIEKPSGKVTLTALI